MLGSAPACLGSRGTARARARALVRVLGIAQDGGLPHAACDCARCSAARHDSTRARRVACLAIGTGAGRLALIDATPDLPDQLAAVHDLAALRPSRRSQGARGRVDRAPLDALFLSHAHMGHYTGLAHLGFEAVDARGIATHVTPRMADFLTNNGPWAPLVERGNLILSAAAPGTPVLLDDVTVTPQRVPHRDELSDTVGYRIAGPRRTVLYIPDCKPWHQWTTAPETLFEGVDVALLDGTFYSEHELPGRDVRETGHPLMTDTMDRFAPHVAGGTQVRFTHLNHSNPTLQPGSHARKTLTARGYSVAREGADLLL